MEFHIQMNGAKPDVEAIKAAFIAIDPSALVDIDPAGGALRVAAVVDVVELVSLFSRAGHPVSPAQVTQVPSICCGGCSG